MPITRRQFKLEIDPKIEEWMKRIHQFLAEHKDKAFTNVELKNLWRADFEPHASTATEHQVFEEALRKLVELRAVELRKIRDIFYFSYKKELEEPF